jgi:hypothetical protein
MVKSALTIAQVAEPASAVPATVLIGFAGLGNRVLKPPYSGLRLVGRQTSS